MAPAGATGLDFAPESCLIALNTALGGKVVVDGEALSDPLGLIGKFKIIASVSGGKDSTAMALLLKERGFAFDPVFIDTGWEHESTYEYLRDVLEPVIGPIRTIASDGGGMESLVRKKGMFPSRVTRFCTQELKVYPMAKLITESGGLVINAVGVRAGESAARASLEEWEAMPPIGAAATWRPIFRWSEEQVMDIMRRHDVPPNPLYLKGASRVGCFPCIYARKEEIRLVADLSPGRIATIRNIERELTSSARERNPDARERTFFQSRTPSGDGATFPIDEAVRWSRTSRGGRQYDLLGPDPNAGCMRWGLCDTGEK